MVWWFSDFQNGGRSPSWILKICSFCHVALVYIPFCFLVQNFTVIGQSVDELWPKNRLSRWRLPPSWILKILIFGHVTVIVFNICFCVPNFIKIGWFFTEIWWFSDFKMAAVRHLGFVMTSQYCIAGHIFVVQILSWNFMLIGVIVSIILYYIMSQIYTVSQKTSTSNSWQ